MTGRTVWDVIVENPVDSALVAIVLICLALLLVRAAMNKGYDFKVQGIELKREEDSKPDSIAKVITTGVEVSKNNSVRNPGGRTEQGKKESSGNNVNVTVGNNSGNITNIGGDQVTYNIGSQGIVFDEMQKGKFMVEWSKVMKASGIDSVERVEVSTVEDGKSMDLAIQISNYLKDKGLNVEFAHGIYGTNGPNGIRKNVGINYNKTSKTMEVRVGYIFQ